MEQCKQNWFSFPVLGEGADTVGSLDEPISTTEQEVLGVVDLTGQGHSEIQGWHVVGTGGVAGRASGGPDGAQQGVLGGAGGDKSHAHKGRSLHAAGGVAAHAHVADEGSSGSRG